MKVKTPLHVLKANYQKSILMWERKKKKAEKEGDKFSAKIAKGHIEELEKWAEGMGLLDIS
jgi:hypothetical protein